MDTILERVLRSPKLPHYFEVIGTTLAKEKELRQKFYEQITEDAKWEFINGQIVLHSPATARHSEVRAQLATLLSTYVKVHKLGAVYDEKALIRLTRNDYEPDVCFFGQEKVKQIQPHTLYFPVPDFIAEVLSKSTEKNDRGLKFEDYAAHGVAEYWVLDPEAETVERFLLEGLEYRQEGDPSSYMVESKAVAGFCVPRLSIFHCSEHLKTLQEILREVNK